MDNPRDKAAEKYLGVTIKYISPGLEIIETNNLDASVNHLQRLYDFRKGWDAAADHLSNRRYVSEAEMMVYVRKIERLVCTDGVSLPRARKLVLGNSNRLNKAFTRHPSYPAIYKYYMQKRKVAG